MNTYITSTEKGIEFVLTEFSCYHTIVNVMLNYFLGGGCLVLGLLWRVLSKCLVRGVLGQIMAPVPINPLTHK